MASHNVSLKRLNQHAFRFAHRPASPQDWERLRKLKPEVPADFAGLRHLASHLFSRGKGPLSALREAAPAHVELAAAIGRATEQKRGTSLMLLFEDGLRNPALTEEEIDQLDHEVAAELPGAKKHWETANFSFTYTDDELLPEENVTLELVKTVADILESNHELYVKLFDKLPYRPGGTPGTKIPVWFHWLSGTSGRTSPDAPIEFDSDGFTKNAYIRQATPPHELFHRLQYAYGAATTYETTAKDEWWLEGMAAWAGAWMTNGIVRDESFVNDMNNALPSRLFSQFSYAAMPFWVFVQGQRVAGKPDFLGARTFLQRYSPTGDARQALAAVVTQAFRETREDNVDWFVNTYYLNVVQKRWMRYGSSGIHDQEPVFKSFTAFDGTEVVVDPLPFVVDHERLDPGEEYGFPGSIPDACARVFWFTFRDECKAYKWLAQLWGQPSDRQFFLSAVGCKRDNVAWTQLATFPPTEKPTLSREIDLSQYDSLYLILSFASSSGEPGEAVPFEGSISVP